jgi:phosphoribosylformylglycinamidine synthase
MGFEKRVQAAIRQIVREGLVESAHDLSEGGLAVAVAESSFETGIGARLDLDSDLRPEYLLFGEAPSRILVSSTNTGRIQEIGESFNVPVLRVGTTEAGTVEISNRGARLISSDVQRLRAAWSGAFEALLESRK